MKAPDNYRSFHPEVPGAIDPSHAAVFAAVCRLWSLEGTVGYARLMDLTGYTKQPLYARLVALRDAGLVTWATGRKGTLQPVVTALPVRGGHVADPAA